MENSLTVSYKVKYKFPTLCRDSTPTYVSHQENWKYISYKDLYVDAYSSIHNCEK